MIPSPRVIPEPRVIPSSEGLLFPLSGGRSPMKAEDGVR